MNTLKHLSNDELVVKIQSLVSQERAIQVQILDLLLEIENRKLFLEMGYPTLFTFCVERLQYSESTAMRRIESMRFLKEVPAVKEELKNGNLNLTQVSMAQSLITKKKEPLSGKEKLELVQACQGKSTRESERFLRERLDLKIEVQPEREKVLDEEHVQLQITLTRKQMEMLEQVKQLLSHKNPNPTWAELFELMADQVLKE
jgi:hypothetical protein